MRFNFLNQKIPTLFGVLLIVIGIGATSFLTKNGFIFTGRANPPETPENVRITNITDSSFSVSYTTSASVLGSLSYRTEKAEGKTIFDDRDQQSGTTNPYKTHHITVKGLTPETKYFFTILSGQAIFFAKAGEETPFTVSTGPVLKQQPPKQEPVAGKILLPDGVPAQEALIYLTIDQAQALSTIAKPDGNYVLPLNSMRNQNLGAYFNFPKESRINLLAINESLKSNVVLSLSQTKPVPPITLSKNYDFVVSESPLASSSAEASFSAETKSFPTIAANPGKTKEPQIQTPAEKEGFTDAQPVFKGTAGPGEKVKITIHSDSQIEIEVTADKNGTWNYRPSEKLSPGEHTISIITKDPFGSLKTLQRSFTVYASGSQVSESATPSATPVVRITVLPTPIFSASPTAILSPTPTKISSPTPTLIMQANLTPTVIPQKKIEKPGNPLVEKGLILAFLLITTSLFLVYFNRKNIPL